MISFISGFLATPASWRVDGDMGFLFLLFLFSSLLTAPMGSAWLRVGHLDGGHTPFPFVIGNTAGVAIWDQSDPPGVLMGVGDWMDAVQGERVPGIALRKRK